MTDEVIQTSFWVFEYNLTALLLLLSNICSYDFHTEDLGAIKYGLSNSSDNRGLWFEYKLIGNKTISLTLARDQENRDIIFVKLTASSDFTSQIQLVNFTMDSFSLRPLHFKEN